MQRAQFKIDVQSDEPVWTFARQDLWRRIEQHDFEPDTPLNFTRGLARDHGWNLEYARAAVDAYRRFCFLAIISPTPVTPSKVVDEVWHQHLIYSRDYWMMRCEERLKAPLHHDPTPGGPEAQMIYRRQYAETLALHERVFGSPRPEFWPATHQASHARASRAPLDHELPLAVALSGAVVLLGTGYASVYAASQTMNSGGEGGGCGGGDGGGGGGCGGCS